MKTIFKNILVLLGGCVFGSMVNMGLIIAGLIWFLSGFFLGTPYWLAFIMSPLAIASEWPSLKYIDDNATMILIPLFASLLLMPLYA